MVFPGVLRGRPGPRLATTLTNRPRRSLSSPRMFRSSLPQRRRRLAAAAGQRRLTKATRFQAARGTLHRAGPRAFRFRWRGLTPQWPRSLRLGSASGFNLARASGDARVLARSDPAFSAKKDSRPARRGSSGRREALAAWVVRDPLGIGATMDRAENPGLLIPAPPPGATARGCAARGQLRPASPSRTARHRGNPFGQLPRDRPGDAAGCASGSAARSQLPRRWSRSSSPRSRARSCCCRKPSC